MDEYVINEEVVTDNKAHDTLKRICADCEYKKNLIINGKEATDFHDCQDSCSNPAGMLLVEDAILYCEIDIH